LVNVSTNHDRRDHQVRLVSYLPALVSPPNVPLVPVFHQWLKNLSTAPYDMPLSAQDARNKIRRFRILVVGRANAGKTTLLQKVCNTIEMPEIFDGKGNKVNPTFHPTSEPPTNQSRPGRCRCCEILRRCMYARTIGTFLTNS
jgi:hypothetical protein